MRGFPGGEWEYRDVGRRGRKGTASARMNAAEGWKAPRGRREALQKERRSVTGGAAVSLPSGEREGDLAASERIGLHEEPGLQG